VTEVQAHQLLHGYRGGHGQIAASVKLTDRDSELITRLSDLSGSLSSGLRLDTYLTVYPLPSRRFFAAARTWPDPEAPRAGCVVTHTLLIPVEFWATFTNVRSVNGFFRNPHAAPEYDFSEPFDLLSEMDGLPLDNAEIDVTASKTFVSRYFGRGLRPIVWFNAGEPEEYLWRLLEHLWPKLRCAFSCCTLSLQQRTLEEGPFDLLFAPSAVYSRFTKLSPEHLIEPALGRKGKQMVVEPWCQYWAEAFFSPKRGLPSSEREIPIWTELTEDPTAVRKLSLVHELRLRAAQSSTAGVGAIDVVESLAGDPGVAVPLKRLVLTDAIKAAAAAQTPEDALTSLRLIDDRLRRESFRNLADESSQRLTSAVAQVTKREPEAALQAGGTWLEESIAGTESAFVQGMILGLRGLANSNPSGLTILRSYPAVAAEIFRLEPTFAATYLQVGGDAAPRVLASWLSSTRDAETLRLVRDSVLPLLQRSDDEELLSALLRDLRGEDVKQTLNVLSDISNGFSNQTTQHVVAEQISSAYPELVREWASETRNWSSGISAIVASTYPASRHGFDELLEQSRLTAGRKAEVLAVKIRDQSSGTYPYWLREIASKDVRLVSTLVLAGPDRSDTVEGALSRLLSEVPDLPLAKSLEVLGAVLTFDSRPVFPQLLDSVMRSVITCYVADGTDTPETQEFVNSPKAIGWFQNVSGNRLSALLTQGCYAGPPAVARAWKWIAKAPRTLYQRRSPVLPELCDPLLRYARQSFLEHGQDSFLQVLRRSRSESDSEVGQALSAKMLRFALDNLGLPLGAVVAEAFGDVYAAAIEKNGRTSSIFSIFSILFGSDDWDRGKDLRISLVDAFLRSNWPPGDLAVAASNAGILRKIFKRLHRKSRGDDYIRTMLQDLSQRNDPGVSKIKEHLEALVAAPNFYEEWD
jgi:hypothetical protein